MMRGLSVCSGIGAPELAWRGLVDFVAHSEIDAFPAAVMAERFGTCNWGDMTKFEEWPDAVIDVLVGGTPCQSFSTAGRRKGLDDPRGDLTLTYLAIARRFRPRWLVWENVPGVLSLDAGRVFGAILGAMGKLGYGVAYRVLDAQYFGVPQRRRRVFVVGYLGDWRRAASVLFEPESLRGDPAPRRDTGEDFAATTTNGVGKSGVAKTLTASAQARHDASVETFVTHALGGEGFDASEDGKGRGTPIVPVAFDTTQVTSAGNFSNPKTGDPCHPLAAEAHPPALAYAIQERAVSENPNAGPDGAGVAEDLAYTLEVRGSTQSVLCFSGKDFGADALEGLAPTLRAGGRAAISHPNGGVPPAGAYALRGREGGAVLEGGGPISPALRSADGGATQPMVLQSHVRRLTPRECERLQGFPDDWTRIAWRGKRPEACPDGPRYKAVGNSMAVPVMRWIGRRMVFVDGIGRAAA